MHACLGRSGGQLYTKTDEALATHGQMSSEARLTRNLMYNYGLMKKLMK